jgi:hypothetical protein
MKRKLVSLAIILVIFCSIIPSVFAKAQTNHSRETSTHTVTYTVAFGTPLYTDETNGNINNHAYFNVQYSYRCKGKYAH